MAEQGIQLRQSKLSGINLPNQQKKSKQTLVQNKEFENQNPSKSTPKLPPLKSVKTQENNDQKPNNMQHITNKQPKQSQNIERKCLTSTQNSYVIKKFNSKRRISKKKQALQEFKPQLVAKYNHYVNLLSCVNISNNLKISNSKIEKRFILYVGKGNNGSLIKYIVKNWRPWWQIQENDPQNANINLHWYQLRQNQLLDDFRSGSLSFDESNQYKLENCQQKTNQSHKQIVGRSNSRNSQNRSQSLINRDNCSFLAKTTNFKRSSSKNKGVKQFNSEKGNRLSPINCKTNIKQLKQDVIEQNTKNNRKNLANPKMWPIYTMYRRIFSASDMKQLKKMNAFLENGSLRGQLSQPHMKKIEDISNKFVMHNHLQNNWNLSNKKALFMNIKNYYELKKVNPFEYIPMTFHIQQIGDEQYNSFVEEFEKRSEQISLFQKNYKKSQFKANSRSKRRNAWLVKPGQNSNRGNGIQVVEGIDQIKKIITNQNVDQLGRPRTHIVQQYILPFLYQKRKFDIRCYILITSVNGRQKGYWYQDGYIRTACKQFNMKNLSNKLIHLTNDAVQKKCQQYGRYEPGNKLSFSDFQRYLDMNYNNGQNSQKLKFWQNAYPEMKRIATDAIRAVYTKINPSKKDNSFELFGLDFLIDQNFKIWLIQANTNPCLQLSAPLLGRLIPSLLENTFKIAVDPLFPPPPLSEIAKLTKKILLSQNSVQSNKFQLVFDEVEEGAELTTLLTNAPQVKIYDIEQQEDQYDENEQETKDIKIAPQSQQNQVMICSQKIY